MAWRCRFLTAQRSQHGSVIAEKSLSEELSGAPNALVDFHTGHGVEADPGARPPPEHAHDRARAAPRRAGGEAGARDRPQRRPQVLPDPAAPLRAEALRGRAVADPAAEHATGRVPEAARGPRAEAGRGRARARFQAAVEEAAETAENAGAGTGRAARATGDAAAVSAVRWGRIQAIRARGDGADERRRRRRLASTPIVSKPDTTALAPSNPRAVPARELGRRAHTGHFGTSSPPQYAQSSGANPCSMLRLRTRAVHAAGRPRGGAPLAEREP